MSGRPRVPIDLSTVPALAPPRGVTPNFVDPVDRAPMAIGVISISFVIMTITLALRLYAKKFVTKNFGLEDWVAATAGALTIGINCVDFAILSIGGVGPHTWNVPVTTFTHGFFARFLITQFLYTPAVMLIKVSIFLLFLRVFGFKGAAVRKWILGGIGVCCTVYTVLFVLDLAYCVPDFQTDHIAQGECASKANTVFQVQAAFNVASDFYLLAIPAIVVSKLQMAWLQRLGVIALLSTGMLASILSILVLYFRVLANDDPDTSWNLVDTVIVCCTEMNVGVICACAPCFPSLWNAWATDRMKTWSIRSMFSKNQSSTNSTSRRQLAASGYSERPSDRSGASSLKESGGISRTVQYSVSSDPYSPSRMEMGNVAGKGYPIYFSAV